MDIILSYLGKTVGEHGINWEFKNLIDFDYAHGLSALDKNINEMSAFLRFLGFKAQE